MVTELMLKLFHNLTGPVLYRIVITDNLPSFTLGLAAGPIPGIKSKRELLGYMTHLYLEYLPKTRPTYQDLMVYGAPLFTVADIAKEEPSRAEIKPIAEAESDMIAHHVALLSDVQMENSLPRLSHYAACAFLGGQSMVWEGVWRGGDTAGTWGNVSAARVAVCLFIACSNITKICHRGMFGPLGFPSRLSHPRTRGAGPYNYFATHIEAPFWMAPMLTGPHDRPSARWYFDMLGIGVGRAVTDVYEGISNLVHNVIKSRKTDHTGWDDSELGHRVDMYVPIQHPLIPIPPGQMPQYLERLQQDFLPEKCRELVRMMSDALGVDQKRFADQWVWKAVLDAPNCEACGWSTEDL